MHSAEAALFGGRFFYPEYFKLKVPYPSLRQSGGAGQTYRIIYTGGTGRGPPPGTRFQTSAAGLPPGKPAGEAQPIKNGGLLDPRFPQIKGGTAWHSSAAAASPQFYYSTYFCSAAFRRSI